MHENGEYVGRSAPEIDMFEAQVRHAIPMSLVAEYAMGVGTEKVFVVIGTLKQKKWKKTNHLVV